MDIFFAPFQRQPGAAGGRVTKALENEAYDAGMAVSASGEVFIVGNSLLYRADATGAVETSRLPKDTALTLTPTPSHPRP